MAGQNIGTAAQKSVNTVEVYDEDGRYKFRLEGTLMGFTSSTVTVKKGSSNETYDNEGRYKFRT